MISLLSLDVATHVGEQSKFAAILYTNQSVVPKYKYQLYGDLFNVHESPPRLKSPYLIQRSVLYFVSLWHRQVLPLLRVTNQTSQRFSTLIKLSCQSPRVVYDYPLYGNFFDEYDETRNTSPYYQELESTPTPPVSRLRRSTRRAARYLSDFSNVRAILDSVPHHMFVIEPWPRSESPCTFRARS